MSSITQNKHVLAMAALLAITLMLWIPGGFRMTGLIEEWLLGHLAADGLDRLVRGTIGLAESQFVLRPLHAMPWAVSAAIPPNVIVGQNVLLCLLFFGKAAALYGVMIEILPTERRTAFLTAVLFMIFPADTGLYGLRNLAIHASAFLFILSIYLLLVYARTSAWGWLSGSLIANAAGLLMYESAFPLALIAPFLLLVKAGRKRSTFIVIGIYLLVPIVLAIRYVILMGELQAAYQNYLVDLGMPHGLAASLPDMSNSIAQAFARNAWIAWGEAFASIGNHGDLLWAAGIITVICATAAWWLRGSEEGDQPLSPRTLLILFGLGIAVFLFGFVPYLPTPIRTENERVFILSAAGSALSTLAVCLLFARLIPRRVIQTAVFLIVSCGLIGAASVKALAQHQQVIRYSKDEQHFLASVLDIAPRISPNSCIVVIDAPQSPYFFFYGQVFHEAFQYLFDDYTLRGLFCNSTGTLSCTVDLGAGVIERYDGVRLNCPRDRLIAFDYTPLYSGGHRANLLDQLPAPLTNVRGGAYDPHARISDKLPRAAILDAVFGAWPPESEPGTPIESLRIDFDEPVYGRGWRYSEVNEQGLTWVWVAAPEATLNIGLMRDGPYRLMGHVLWGTASDSFDSLRVTFNGRQLEIEKVIQADGTLTIAGDIPREWIAPDDGNVLSLNIDHLVRVSDEDPYDLGIAVDWLEILPDVK